MSIEYIKRIHKPKKIVSLIFIRPKYNEIPNKKGEKLVGKTIWKFFAKTRLRKYLNSKLVFIFIKSN